MMSVRATTEQRINGQIGQPAACMIENNPVLFAVLAGDMRPEEHRGESGDYGSKDGEVRALVQRFVFARGACAKTFLIAPHESTASVDNFVGNWVGNSRRPRKIRALDRLLKL